MTVPSISLKRYSTRSGWGFKHAPELYDKVWYNLCHKCYLDKSTGLCIAGGPFACYILPDEPFEKIEK